MNYATMEAAPTCAPDKLHEETIAAMVQETKTIAMETLSMLNSMLSGISAMDTEKTDIPEAKCLLHDIAITRRVVQDITGKVRELKIITGC